MARIVKCPVRDCEKILWLHGCGSTTCACDKKKKIEDTLFGPAEEDAIDLMGQLFGKDFIDLQKP